MKKLLSVLLIFCLFLLTVRNIYGQAFHINLIATDGLSTDTLILGNAVGATEGIDTVLGEKEQPPPPFLGSFDVRSIDWGTHKERGAGLLVDYRPYRSPWQSDSFQISYQLDSADTLGGKLHVTWPGNLAGRGCGYWHLLDASGGRRFDIDMTIRTTYEIAGPPNLFWIIYGDSTRYQTVSYFRVAFDHDAKMSLGKATKPDAKKNPTVRPNIHFIAAQLDKATPLAELGNLRTTGGAGPYRAGNDTIRSVILKKYSDILKSLFYAKTQTMHSWLRSCLDSTDAKIRGKKAGSDSTRKYIGKKALTSNPPVKGFQNNTLFAEVIVAKLNVALNDAICGSGPLIWGHSAGPNFGALTVSAFDSTNPLHPWDNKTVMDVINDADNILSCKNPAFPAEPSLLTLQEYHDAVQMINRSFIKTFPDTGSFSTSFAAFDTAAGSYWNGKWPASSDKIIRIKGLPNTCGYLIRRLATSVAAGETVPYTVATAKPKEYSLDQNYPNPFNPSTKISFTLVDNGFVTIKVFDMLGQEVASLADHEEMGIGSNEVEFNANNYASGVYFYRIEVKDETGVLKFQSVKKMMLVK
ncbi:MAG: T9SS type A sorting domain-containing protein [Bacteroidota bacterium]